MNALRNVAAGVTQRTLGFFRTNGQNALINLTQTAPPTPSTANYVAGNAELVNPLDQQQQQNKHKRPQPLLIPKSILDATTFKGKKLEGNAPPAAAEGNISPTTLKRYRRMQRKVELVYRCKLCNTRNAKYVTEVAYTSGVVILQCDGCAVNHLIIDNVGWFANTKNQEGKAKNFDEVLAAQCLGPKDRIRVIKVNEQGELL